MSNRDQQTFKEKRQQFTVKIRNDLRQQVFNKRRNTNNGPRVAATKQEQMMNPKSGKKMLIVDPNYAQKIEVFIKTQYQSDQLPQLTECLYNQDILKQHYGVIGIRKLISIEDDPPIQTVIDAGVVPRLIEYMNQSKYPQLQLEATWALTNVASGTTNQTQCVIDKGGIPLFVRLLSENKEGIAQQAVWAIGNIAGDCVFYRDTILKAGGLEPMIRIIENTADKVLIKQGAWALSNLCRGSPLPKYQYVKAAVPVLCQVVKLGVIDDKDILADCCWAISYLTEGQKSKIQRVIETGVVAAIVKIATEYSHVVVIPAIRILGNIVTGNQLQTEEVLKAGGLDCLEVLLDNHKKTVRRQACWVLSNIAAGTKGQVQKILQRENLIVKILKLFESDSPDVKREICWIFSNLAHLGDPYIIMQIYQKYSIVRYYVNLLFSEDSKVIENSLECLYIVLSVGEKVKFGKSNQLITELFNSGAIDILEKLQQHESTDIYKKVIKIMERYFEIENPLQF